MYPHRSLILTCSPRSNFLVKKSTRIQRSASTIKQGLNALAEIPVEALLYLLDSGQASTNAAASSQNQDKDRVLVRFGIATFSPPTLYVR